MTPAEQSTEKTQEIEVTPEMIDCAADQIYWRFFEGNGFNVAYDQLVREAIQSSLGHQYRLNFSNGENRR